MHRCLHQHRVTLVPPSVFRGAVDAVHLPATAETLRPVAWVISTFFQLLLLAQSLTFDPPRFPLLPSQGPRWLLVELRFLSTCARARWPRALRASRLSRRTSCPAPASPTSPFRCSRPVPTTPALPLSRSPSLPSVSRASPSTCSSTRRTTRARGGCASFLVSALGSRSTCRRRTMRSTSV